MALQITLVKTPAKVSVSKSTQLYDKKGGTLGRSDSNGWVLPDPDKFLSSCHCEVLFEANTYFILDLSTNGTFFNNSLEPLGKGTKAPLNDGDFFEAGEYRFSVKVVAVQNIANNSPFASQPSVANSPTTTDIFGSRESANPSFADPYSGAGFLPQDFSLGENSQSVDPLIALDQAGNISKKDAFGQGSFFDQPKSAIPTNDDFLGYGHTDHSPSIDQAISWPTSAQENLIPEDWGGDFMEPTPIPSAPAPKKNRAEFTSSDPVSANPFITAPMPSANELLNKKAPAPITVTPQKSAPIITPPAAPVQAPIINASARVTPEHAQIVSGGRNTRLISAMGLDVNKFTTEQADEINDIVGELMREIVDGMMQVLRSRTSIKNEFRMNVTTIQPVENNPLKFSVGVDEALETMFIKKTNAYKKPIDAFREGFQEIGEHQVAMIAGIRFGFERMVERFNPDNLEKNFNKHGKSTVIPGMQKAKYWNNYKDYYVSFMDNMESSFQHLFGSDFVNAYEDQLRKLAAARKKIKQS